MHLVQDVFGLGKKIVDAGGRYISRAFLDETASNIDARQADEARERVIRARAKREFDQSK